MSNRNQRERRTFHPFEARDTGDGKVIEGYAVVFDSPTVLYEVGDTEYKEQIQRGAFDQADMRDVILNFDHAGKVLARTRNDTLQLRVDERGLFVRARLDGTEEGRSLYEEVAGGYLDKMSFAFTVADETYDPKVRLRSIRKIKRLYDVSVVSMPAYHDTEVSARGFFSAVADQENALERARKRLMLLTQL